MKIVVLSSTQSHLEPIRKMIPDDSPARQVVLVKDGAEQLLAIADQEHPDLFILDETCCGIDELATLEQLSLRYPRMAFILVCENTSHDFLISAMRIGVKDVLHPPLDSKALQEAVNRIEQRLKPAASGQHQRAKVIAFIACKGGSGATFLATNLGYILANKDDVKVALLDVNLQFGDAALFVSDQVPANTIADVAENIARLDASLLASSMVQVAPNFGLLAAPEDPEQAAGIRPEHIDTLLNLAIANYDYVILDVGRILNANSVKALDHADLIFPIVQETLPFIRDGKRLTHTLLTLGYPKEKIHLVVNRHQKGVDIQLEDVSSALGMPISNTIPNSYEAVSTSVNQGIPIFKIARHDPVTKALIEMADNLVQAGHAKKSGWLSHIFHPK